MTTTPAGQQPPHLAPVLGDWQPLPNAGATTHTPDTTPNIIFDRLIQGRSPSDWAIRIVLVAVMGAALAVGTWSIYTLLTDKLDAPKAIAVLGCGMFDIAALFFALLSQKYAITTDSGLAPRTAMLAMVSTSAWVNWQHGQLEGWGLVGSVILAAAPVIAELAFEMFHRYAHRETLRNLGRVAQTLPVLGKWAWLAHPFRSRETLDKYIQAALTEHEAIADRRVDLAEERARCTVSLPESTALAKVSPARLPQVSLERLDKPETETSETRPAATETETPHETAKTAPVSPHRETETAKTETSSGDQSPGTETETGSETGTGETETQASAPWSRPQSNRVVSIGDPETETSTLLDLIRSRGDHMAVSLDDAMKTTGRPKSTAAKRLKAARDQYLAETETSETKTETA